MKHCLKSHLKRTTRRTFKTMLSKNRTALRKFDTDQPKICANFRAEYRRQGRNFERVKTIPSSKIRGKFVPLSCPSKFRCFSLLFVEFRRNSSKFALITFAQYCMLKEIHRSHIGIGGCLRRAQELLYWPRINAEVKDYVSKCSVCQS